MLLGYGGSYSIESPEPYSAVAKGVIEELGIEVSNFTKYLDRNLYSSSGRVPKIFFDKETFGADKLVDDPYPFPGGETYDLAVPAADAWTHFMAEAPIAEQARKDFSRLCREKKDYLPGLNVDEQQARLARISYVQFLAQLAGMHGDVIRRIEQNRDIIGHVHTAGNPGRGELDDRQEIQYPAIMRKLLEIKYSGYIGQEFIPTRNPMEGLRQAVRLCDV